MLRATYLISIHCPYMKMRYYSWLRKQLLIAITPLATKFTRLQSHNAQHISFNDYNKHKIPHH